MGTCNVRSVNQGKLEVVKQEMAIRVISYCISPDQVPISCSSASTLSVPPPPPPPTSVQCICRVPALSAPPLSSRSRPPAPVPPRIYITRLRPLALPLSTFTLAQPPALGATGLGRLGTSDVGARSSPLRQGFRLRPPVQARYLGVGTARSWGEEAGRRKRRGSFLKAGCERASPVPRVPAQPRAHPLCAVRAANAPARHWRGR